GAFTARRADLGRHPCARSCAPATAGAGANPSWRAASGSPSRTLRHRGAHPLAARSLALLNRSEREASSTVLPPSRVSQRGMGLGAGGPLARAHTSANSFRVTGSSSQISYPPPGTPSAARTAVAASSWDTDDQ